MTKKHTAEALIETHNRLRKELITENEDYFSDLVVYIRSAGLFYDSEKVETHLLEILQDVLSAQEDGLSAREYFGQEPQGIADELIATFPKATRKEKIKLVGYILGMSVLMSIISGMASTNTQFNLVPFILSAVASVFWVELVFWLIHKSIYLKLASSKRSMFFLSWGLGVAIIGSLVGIQFIRPAAFNITVPSGLINSLIVLLLIVLVGLTIFGKKAWRHFLIAILPLALINGAVRLLQTTPHQIAFLTEDVLSYLSLGGSLLATVWLYVMLYRETKQVP